MKYIALNLPGSITINPPASLHLPEYTNRYTILNNSLSLFISLIAILSIGFLIWGGIQMIMSEGDKQKVQAARSRITYAIIGLVITFLAVFIVQLIGYFFSVKLLTL